MFLHKLPPEETNGVALLHLFLLQCLPRIVTYHYGYEVALEQAGLLLPRTAAI